MGTAILFGLPIEDWKSLASLLTAPAFAMAAIYIIGVDLVKLPFLAIDVPYRVPPRLVQWTAFVLVFILSMTLAIWLTLRTHTGPRPDTEGFLHQFFRDLSAEEAAWLHATRQRGVVGGRIKLLEYDGRSGARVYVNNKRIFGTHVDCLAIYQCRPNAFPSLAELQSQINKVRLNDIFPFNAEHRLPLIREFSSHLRQGESNIIDILASNSGVGACNIVLEIELDGPGGERSSRRFQILSSSHDDKRYKTIDVYASYRVCDNVRLKLS
jgi:hypothetical protein